MLMFGLLLFAILLMSAGVSGWLSDTGLAGRGLCRIISIITASTLISLLFDISVIAYLPVTAFVAVSLGIGGLVFFSQWKKISKGFHPRFHAIAILFLIYLLSCRFIPHSGRWGRWDAKAIWTLHALFLSHENGWRNLFSPAISWSHPDYPLMLPSFIAMCWKTLGRTDALIPCVIAYAVFVSVLIAVSSGLKQKDKAMAGIAGLVPFFFCNDYMRMAASQGADTLISLLILVTLIIARQNTKASNEKLLFLAGFMAGFAGWVKNEGIAFTVVFSLITFLQHRKAPRRFFVYLAGMVLPLVVIILFKVLYAPANDILSGQGQNTISRLADCSRYQLCLEFFLHNAWHLYPALIVLGVVVMIKSYRLMGDRQMILLAGMLIVYFFTFVITPRDQRWQLETASDRLFLQLFPGAVYVLISLLAD